MQTRAPATAAHPEFRVELEREEGRVFIAAKNMQVEVLIDHNGLSVLIIKGNSVLAECSADYES